MKLIDAYNNYKIKYKEYVVLLKSGIFYECFNDDISIMYSLFSYKIKNNGSNYVVGFPSSSLTKVLNTLEKNKINYIIIEDNVGNLKKSNAEYKFLVRRGHNRNYTESDLGNCKKSFVCNSFYDCVDEIEKIYRGVTYD